MLPKLTAFLLPITVFTCLALLPFTGYSQDSSKAEKVLAFPEKAFSFLDKKTSEVNKKIENKTIHYLARLEKQESRLKKKLARKDPKLADSIFGNIHEKYEGLRKLTDLKDKTHSVYSGHLDSLSTALAFLNQVKLAPSSLTGNNLDQLKKLQANFNISEAIQKQLAARKKMLRQQLEKLGMVKQFRKYQKDVYYYSAQVKQYRQIFEDPSRLEAKLMEYAMKIPAFRDFFRKHSMLGSLFPSTASSSSGAALAGLQTRASVSQALSQRFGNSQTALQLLQQNVSAGQGQLTALKNKIASLKSGSYGNSNDELPDFKPNSQKTKSFFKRLELGMNVQSQKSRMYFPSTSDIALSIGYKLNDKSILGLGVSYKLGLGRGWDKISLTHQGIGLRSYLDYKIKGSLYITGGYEQNYLTAFRNIQQLQDYSAWQSSGLIGISKRYRVSKKLKGDMRLMWDFLSYRQVPRTQAILFRIGYNFN